MKIETETLHLLQEALQTLEKGFSTLPEVTSDIDLKRLREVILFRGGVRLRYFVIY